VPVVQQPVAVPQALRVGAIPRDESRRGKPGGSRHGCSGGPLLLSRPVHCTSRTMIRWHGCCDRDNLFHEPRGQEASGKWRQALCLSPTCVAAVLAGETPPAGLRTSQMVGALRRALGRPEPCPTGQPTRLSRPLCTASADCITLRLLDLRNDSRQPSFQRGRRVFLLDQSRPIPVVRVRRASRAAFCLDFEWGEFA
jgi:hypothetical protein